MRILILLLTVATFTFSQSQPQVYTYQSDGQGFHTKTFFYDNGLEVVVFGAQFTPELAQEALTFLRTKTDSPVSYLVVTHPNPDKFNGAKVFQNEGAKVIASRATYLAMPGVHEYKKYYFVHIAKMFSEDEYPEMPEVDYIFDQEWSLTLSQGDVLELKELGIAGVSSNQTVGYLPAVGGLMVGDLVHHKAHAWLEGGIVDGQAQATLGSWSKCLDLIEKTYSAETVIYAGRGEAVSLPLAVKEQKKYLNIVQSSVAEYIQQLGERKEELLGEKAGEHHQAIEKMLEKRFSEYEISYMIGFGIYGLINDLLKK